MITQLGQFSQSADPVEALAACAKDPAACKNFSTILVNLTSATPNRQVLELIAGAMAKGSQGGKNPFYASPMAVDLMRIHADADPNAASDLLIQATEALLADSTTAQASQGKDGFFAHVIDGLLARVLIFTKVPTPPDLRVRVVRLLQTIAASPTLTDAAQRAQSALGQLQPAPTPQPVPLAPVPAPTPKPVAVAPATSRKFSKAQIGAIAIGLGAIVVGGAAFLLSQLPREPKQPEFGAGRLRRRVEDALHKKAARAHI